MRNPFKMHVWPPYAVGIVLGGVLVGGCYSGYSIGFSTPFATISCLLYWLGSCMPSFYCATEFPARPLIDFRVLLVLGAILGAFVSAQLSGSYREVCVPELWKKRFGPSRVKRYWCAFFGGLLIMIGAPIAGGCTLSRGVFVAGALEASGWLFLLATFASAVVVSYGLYGSKSEG